jgi:hypothetical protein
VGFKVAAEEGEKTRCHNKRLAFSGFHDESCLAFF